MQCIEVCVRQRAFELDQTVIIDQAIGAAAAHRDRWVVDKTNLDNMIDTRAEGVFPARLRLELDAVAHGVALIAPRRPAAQSFDQELTEVFPARCGVAPGRLEFGDDVMTARSRSLAQA